MCTEMASESVIRSDLPTRTAPASWAFASVRFGTPGDHLHIERERVAGDARPEATEADDAERFAGEAHAHRHATLEAAGSHSPVGGGMARAAAISRPSASSAVA